MSKMKATDKQAMDILKKLDELIDFSVDLETNLDESESIEEVLLCLEDNALVDAGALLCLTCAMGDEREDLSSYINRFEIDPRYGLFGTSIEKVAYFLQDGMKPTELVKPHYKCR